MSFLLYVFKKKYRYSEVKQTLRLLLSEENCTVNFDESFNYGFRIKFMAWLFNLIEYYGFVAIDKHDYYRLQTNSFRLLSLSKAKTMPLSKFCDITGMSNLVGIFPGSYIPTRLFEKNIDKHLDSDTQFIKLMMAQSDEYKLTKFIIKHVACILNDSSYNYKFVPDYSSRSTVKTRKFKNSMTYLITRKSNTMDILEQI